MHRQPQYSPNVAPYFKQQHSDVNTIPPRATICLFPISGTIAFITPICRNRQMRVTHAKWHALRLSQWLMIMVPPCFVI